MSKYKKYEYPLDLCGIRPNSFFGAPIVLSILSIIGVLGIIDYFLVEIDLVEQLAMFYLLGHPATFLILWCVTSLEVFVRSKSIASQVCNINNVGSYSPELRVYFYMLYSTLSLGFGLIFGTMGIFVTIDNPVAYLSVIGSAMLFVSISGIIARGYINDSPISNFIVETIKSKLKR